MIGRALTLVVVALALLASACSGSSWRAATTGPSSSSTSHTLGPLTRLTDLAHPDKTVDLFSLFNADQGTPRLIMLVSPT
jgi:hypothetical protein